MTNIHQDWAIAELAALDTDSSPVFTAKLLKAAGIPYECTPLGAGLVTVAGTI